MLDVGAHTLLLTHKTTLTARKVRKLENFAIAIHPEGGSTQIRAQKGNPCSLSCLLSFWSCPTCGSAHEGMVSFKKPQSKIAESVSSRVLTPFWYSFIMARFVSDQVVCRQS